MTDNEADQNAINRIQQLIKEGKFDINKLQGYNQQGTPMMMGNPQGGPMMMGNPQGGPMMMGNPQGAQMMMGNPQGAQMMMGNPQGVPMNYQYNMGFQQGAQMGQQQFGAGQINPQIIPMGGGAPQVNQANQQGEQQNQKQFPFGNQTDNQPNQPGNQPNQPGNQPNQPGNQQNQPGNQPNQPQFGYPQGYPVNPQFPYNNQFNPVNPQFPVANPQGGQVNPQFPFAAGQGQQQLNAQTVYVTSSSPQQPQVGMGGINQQQMWGQQPFMPWMINPPVSPSPPVEPALNSSGWTLTFEGRVAPIKIQISSDKTTDEAISHYRIKSGDNMSTKFTYGGGKPLASGLKLSESGLQNNSVINVETNNSPAQPQFYPAQGGRYNLIFEQKAGGQTLTIQIQPDKKVSDAINSYKNKIQYPGEMKFIFNGQNLNPDLTLNEAGLKNGSKILVIGTKDIEGA